MGQKDAVRPAFSAGPLLMPPIQLKGISGQAAAASLSRTFPQPAFPMPNARVRLPFWPCLRKFGSRYLYGAQVVPLTLSSIIREDRSGSPAMHRNERGRWIPGKPPVQAGSDAARAIMPTRSDTAPGPVHTRTAA